MSEAQREKRDKLLRKYFPEVLTVKTDEFTKNYLYQGLMMGYFCGQRDSEKNTTDELFKECLK